MSTAEKAAANLHSMPDHPALAVLANRRYSLYCAFEAVERVPYAGGYQFESLVVLVTANFAFRHLPPLPSERDETSVAHDLPPFHEILSSPAQTRGSERIRQQTQREGSTIFCPLSQRTSNIRWPVCLPVSG